MAFCFHRLRRCRNRSRRYRHRNTLLRRFCMRTDLVRYPRFEHWGTRSSRRHVRGNSSPSCKLDRIKSIFLCDSKVSSFVPPCCRSAQTAKNVACGAVCLPYAHFANLMCCASCVWMFTVDRLGCHHGECQRIIFRTNAIFRIQPHNRRIPDRYFLLPLPVRIRPCASKTPVP